MSEVLVWLQKIDGLNSLNLTFWLGAWEFLFKWLISFAQEHIEKKMKKENLIACALTETEDHINSFQVHSMSSENLWKTLVFDIFWWLNRNRILAWNGLTVDLQVLMFIIQKQSSFQRLRRPESRFQRPDPSVQIPASRVQRPESRVQRPASRVQHPGSSVQSPASRVQSLASRVQHPASRVQRPESRVQHPTFASRVQEFRYAHSLQV